MRMTLPNLLTVLRLLAAPGVAIMFLYFNRPLADWFALILFLGAAVTDWLDGHLARAWRQESKLGAMLDPIADKAMVVIALMVLTAFSGLTPWMLLPATVILFREVFVSGLREYLGDTGGTLKVTKLAKWKTTAQMVAIAVLFAHGAMAHYLVKLGFGTDAPFVRVARVCSTTGDGTLQGLCTLWSATWYGGLALLWAAAALTLVTGWDYFRKAMPYLREDTQAPAAKGERT